VYKRQSKPGRRASVCRLDDILHELHDTSHHHQHMQARPALCDRVSTGFGMLLICLSQVDAGCMFVKPFQKNMILRRTVVMQFT
jgi:hypothetical protein